MSKDQITLYVGGVAALVAGIVLLFKGQDQVGVALVVAGAGELGVKVASTV